jgi:hypothetical protein
VNLNTVLKKSVFLKGIYKNRSQKKEKIPQEKNKFLQKSGKFLRILNKFVLFSSVSVPVSFPFPHRPRLRALPTPTDPNRPQQDIKKYF